MPAYFAVLAFQPNNSELIRPIDGVAVGKRGTPPRPGKLSETQAILTRIKPEACRFASDPAGAGIVLVIAPVIEAKDVADYRARLPAQWRPFIEDNLADEWMIARIDS